jgi:SAM-dependent methyltransferase
MDIAGWAVLVGVSTLSLAVVAAIGIATVAFCQGREMCLWPPKIGVRPIDSHHGKGPTSLNSGPAVTTLTPTKPHASGASGVVRSYPARQIRLPAKDRLFDREFTVDQAWEFYQNVAPHYDQRNSGKLINTHRQTARLIRQTKPAGAPLRVLDLGGGTGLHVASSFIDDPGVFWHYVDFSSAMHEQLQNHFMNSVLARNLATHQNDIRASLNALVPTSYDVVLLSLVLSSMPSIPDFDQLAALVAPGGAIVISDIDPSYAALHPHYAVEVDGSRYALRLNPVNPLALISSAHNAGFHSSDPVSIADTNNDQLYSFIAVFKADS